MTNWLDELRARLEFALGTPTFIVAIVEHDAAIAEGKRILEELLRRTPLSIADLGEASVDTGPRRWAELTREGTADICLLSAAPKSTLGLGAMMRLYNTERELLRSLARPLVLVISRTTEKVIREHAPDFFTWIAKTYELPSLTALTALAELTKEQGLAPTKTSLSAPDEDPIRFLHISDIHLRPDRVKRYDQDRVLRGLIEILTRDKAAFPLDLIFVTGDLAQSGRAEEYALVTDFLKRLLDVTGVAPDHMFVVPGNHDVDRGVGKWLLRTLTSDQESIAFFEEPNSRQFHAQKFNAYRTSMGALFGDERPLGLEVGGEAVEIVEVRGARLAVASFNSAWFAQGDDDKGKLWLGEPNVDRAGQRIADEEASFAIALMHHPFTDLHESDSEGVGRYLERSFDLVLRGHLHKDKTRSIATQRGGFIEVAGPAAYQGSMWPNGCFVGKIRPKAREVWLKPYSYVSRADNWVLDAKVFPDDDENGYCHTFIVPEKKRTMSAAVKQLESAAEDAVRGALPSEQREIALALGVAGAGERPLPEVVRHAVKAARASATDDTLSNVFRSASAGIGKGVGRELVEALAAHTPGANVSAAEPGFLERALRLIASSLSRVDLRARIPSGRSEEWVLSAIQEALAYLITDAAVTAQPLIHGLRPDILIESPHSIASQRAIIEVMRPLGPKDREKKLASSLERLDVCIDASGAQSAALVLFGFYSAAETEPKIEHTKTPAGRDVLLLRL